MVLLEIEATACVPDTHVDMNAIATTKQRFLE
jgi:hypothetical protein